MSFNLNQTSPIEVSSTANVTTSASTNTSVMLIPENSHPIYIYSMWAILSTYDTFTFLLSLLVVAFVGLNRLSAIPVIVMAFAAMANGLDWYSWSSHNNPVARRAASIAAYTGWTVQEVGSPFYSYFILERILRGWQRVTFMSIFMSLSMSTFLLRIFTVYYLVKQDAMATLAQQVTLQPIINRLSLGFYTTTAAAESLSAFFLLKTFFSARKSRRTVLRRKSGVLQHLALSTEIRVATLAGVGIVRASVMSAKHYNPVAKALDVVAIILQNFFCMVLIFDLIATRLVQLEARCADYMAGGNLSNSNTGNSDGRKVGVVRGMARRFKKKAVGTLSLEDDSMELSGKSAGTAATGPVTPVFRRFYGGRHEAEISPATNAVTEVTISEEFRQYLGPSRDTRISSHAPHYSHHQHHAGHSSGGWGSTDMTSPGIGEKIMDFSTIDATMRSNDSSV